MSGNYFCAELKNLYFSILLTVLFLVEFSKNRDRSECSDRDQSTREGGDAPAVPQVPLGVSLGSVTALLFGHLR